MDSKCSDNEDEYCVIQQQFFLYDRKFYLQCARKWQMYTKLYVFKRSAKHLKDFVSVKSSTVHENRHTCIGAPRRVVWRRPTYLTLIDWLITAVVGLI